MTDVRVEQRKKIWTEREREKKEKQKYIMRISVLPEQTQGNNNIIARVGRRRRAFSAAHNTRTTTTRDSICRRDLLITTYDIIYTRTRTTKQM